MSSKAGQQLVQWNTPTFNRWASNSVYRPFSNYMLFNNKAYWQKLSGMQDLFDWYHTNPVFYATVMIKAREYANMRVKVVNRNNEAVEPEDTRKPIPKKIYQIFNNPNVMQSTWEWMQQRKIFLEVAGNEFTYGNFTEGAKPTIDNLIALWNVWPANMEFKLAGNFFEATEVEDIISKWKFKAGRYEKEWEPHEILHRNKPNTNVSDGLIFGQSTAHSLTRPLTNIDMAYESRNVIMRNRGMRVILTSDRQDQSGNIPLQEPDKVELQEAIKKYGLLEEQSQFFFSNQPLRAVPIDQDVMKLGLFEEIATDAMMVANGYGVPEILLKLYIRGATFENQEASVRRLYQGTLIPEAIDDMLALTTFLGLDDTDWRIVPSFDHVPVLQESENQKMEAKSKMSAFLINELNNGLITKKIYWERMGYGPIPPELDEEVEVIDKETEPANA